MLDEDGKYPLYLYFFSEAERGVVPPRRVLKVQPVRRLAESIRNMTGHAFNNLNITAEQGADFNDRAPYWFEASYMNCFKVDAARAREIAKTLDSILKKLESIAKKAGPPSSFGWYVARVGQILGAEGIVREKPGTARPSNRYSDMTFQFFELEDGAAAIDRDIEDFKAKNDPAAAAVELKKEAVS